MSRITQMGCHSLGGVASRRSASAAPRLRLLLDFCDLERAAVESGDVADTLTDQRLRHRRYVGETARRRLALLLADDAVSALAHRATIETDTGQWSLG